MQTVTLKVAETAELARNVWGETCDEFSEVKLELQQAARGPFRGE